MVIQPAQIPDLPFFFLCQQIVSLQAGAVSALSGNTAQNIDSHIYICFFYLSPLRHFKRRSGINVKEITAVTSLFYFVQDGVPPAFSCLLVDKIIILYPALCCDYISGILHALINAHALTLVYIS